MLGHQNLLHQAGRAGAASRARLPRLTSGTEPAPPRPWEHAVTAILPFGDLALRPGEVERWFGNTFHVTQVTAETSLPSWPRAWAAYLMTRR